jgi:hypothetical protein
MAKVTRRNPDETTPQWRYINQQEKLIKVKEEKRQRFLEKQKEIAQANPDYKITDEEMNDVWINPEFAEMLDNLKQRRLAKYRNDKLFKD